MTFNNSLRETWQKWWQYFQKAWNKHTGKVMALIADNGIHLDGIWKVEVWSIAEVLKHELFDKYLKSRCEVWESYYIQVINSLEGLVPSWTCDTNCCFQGYWKKCSSSWILGSKGKVYMAIDRFISLLFQDDRKTCKWLYKLVVLFEIGKQILHYHKTTKYLKYLLSIWRESSIFLLW